LEKHFDGALNTEWHFNSAHQKKSNFMHWLKMAILAIFKKGLGWPCPGIAALKK
jgi:hypothetical protein